MATDVAGTAARRRVLQAFYDLMAEQSLMFSYINTMLAAFIGGAVLACRTRMYDIAQSGHVPVISAMGNLPVVKDLVVDMQPFWQKIRAIKPYLDTKGDDSPDTEWRVTPQDAELIHKESLCILCGCCVSECNSMESDPDFLGPAALAKGMRFVGDVRDGATVERLEKYSEEHGIWDCTRCMFCNERCPKGVDPRDAIEKLGAIAFQEKVTKDKGARHAKAFLISMRTGGKLNEQERWKREQHPFDAYARLDAQGRSGVDEREFDAGGGLPVGARRHRRQYPFSHAVEIDDHGNVRVRALYLEVFARDLRMRRRDQQRAIVWKFGTVGLHDLDRVLPAGIEEPVPAWRKDALEAAVARQQSTLIVGDVNKTPLRDILRGEPLRALLRRHEAKDFPEACKLCSRYESVYDLGHIFRRKIDVE